MSKIDLQFFFHILWKIHKSHILQLRQKIFLGANFRNIARMHNSTDYVTFLEKSLAPFLKKRFLPFLKSRFFAKIRQNT